jgi:hypothetical protein
MSRAWVSERTGAATWVSDTCLDTWEKDKETHRAFVVLASAYHATRDKTTYVLSLAYAFSAKEAAFKSLAAPLRSWYQANTEELVFDLRDFELADDFHEAGSARKGAAARAMARMGISCIELARTELCGLALTFAVALGR